MSNTNFASLNVVIMAWNWVSYRVMIRLIRNKRSSFNRRSRRSLPAEARDSAGVSFWPHRPSTRKAWQGGRAHSLIILFERAFEMLSFLKISGR